MVWLEIIDDAPDHASTSASSATGAPCRIVGSHKHDYIVATTCWSKPPGARHVNNVPGPACMLMLAIHRSLLVNTLTPMTSQHQAQPLPPQRTKCKGQSSRAVQAHERAHKARADTSARTTTSTHNLEALSVVARAYTAPKLLPGPLYQARHTHTAYIVSVS